MKTFKGISENEYQDHAVPAFYLEKWQCTINTMASIFEVPAGLIMRVMEHEIEVLVSSQSENNPYEAKERAPLQLGLYCETVMETKATLQVPNALEDEEWKNNPDVALNMISYLGIPLFWNTNEIFGTICVLDKTTRYYSQKYFDILQELKKLIESDFLVIQQQRVLEQQNRELHTTNEALIAANKAKSAFLSTMSHELRTPLNAILGFSEILGKRMGYDRIQYEQLSIIRRSGEHLLTIINDILDLSKIESGRMTLDPQVIDLGELLSDLTAMLTVRAESKSINLTIDQTSSFPRFVKIDSAKLRQIIVNLVGNALKFTNEGSITIRLCTHVHRNGKDHHQIIGEVIDTGKGIAPENLERIMDPFVQIGQHEGTGLGLTITRQLCQRMEGDLTVSSVLGEGSTFRFVVAYEPSDHESLPVNQVVPMIESITNGTDFRILIVEDHPENRQLLRQLLEPHGFQLKEATDGSEGLALFESWKPHCILMDRRMPGMDGLATTKVIRNIDSSNQTVIIAVTAQAFKEERHEMVAAGCNGFIAKPFRSEELFEVLGNLLPLQITYAEVKKGTTSEFAKPTFESIERIPESLRNRFRTALEASNMGEINLYISDIVQIDYSLGKWFESKAERFEYGILLSALCGTEGTE